LSCVYRNREVRDKLSCVYRNREVRDKFEPFPTVGVNKSRRKRRCGGSVELGQVRNVYKHLVGKVEGKNVWVTVKHTLNMKGRMCG
jgi:hypothetical protein